MSDRLHSSQEPRGRPHGQEQRCAMLLHGAIPSNAETQHRHRNPSSERTIFGRGPSVRRTGPHRWHPANALVTAVAECSRVVFEVSLFLVNVARTDIAGAVGDICHC